MTKIIIDPGHGGQDPGAVHYPYREKDWALDISLQLAQVLKEAGLAVALTREQDSGLEPAERTALVQASGASLCISNHINAGGGQGAEVIHSIHRSPSRLAALILDELAGAGMDRRRVFSRESTKYPGQDYYFMLRDTLPVETVIVEYGFIDNEQDRLKLANPSFREVLARATAQGVIRYLAGNNEAAEPPPASAIVVDFAGREHLFPKELGKLLDGRWYLEGRTLTELAGGEVSWDGKQKTARFDFSR